MNNKPFFSIVIPTFNRADLIEKTILSVLSQTYQAFEIIIVDDGGKDHTEDVINRIETEKIKYFKKENGERGAARNLGIARSKGDIITFLDSDDILYPNHLAEAYKFYSQNNHPACFAQAYEIKDALSNKILSPSYHAKGKTINHEITKGNFLSCFGVFITREIFKSNQFEEDRQFAGTEDWLLWLQLAARYSFYYNNILTGAMLEHRGRSVLSFNEKSLVYRAELLKTKLEDDPIFLQRFGRKCINKIYGHMLSYTSLHLAMSNQKLKAIKYLLKAGIFNPTELMSKRAFSIAKKTLLPKF